jgi:CMP-N,N'-diacetyllegionaminic acid synthase
MEILAIVPARGGSKRIPNKNIKDFLGKPLIAYTIKQALDCEFISRVIVDTDSRKISDISKKYGAEVPWLRPKSLATDKTNYVDSLLYNLRRLKRDQNYAPDYVMIMQTTSPLREVEDIIKCLKLMKKGKATTVLTICETHPRLYHLGKDNFIKLVNGSERKSTNIQDWPEAYILNGCFVYLVKTSALLKEKIVITKKTKALVCDKWRSIDLDTKEDWAIAEFLFKNKKSIKHRIKKI